MSEIIAFLQLCLAIIPVFHQTTLQILSGFADVLGGAIPLVVGILIIILVVEAVIVFLPAIIVAIVVWFLTGSFLFAGIAFLVVAVLSLVTLI